MKSKLFWDNIQGELCATINDRWHIRIVPKQGAFFWSLDDWNVSNGVVRRYGVHKTCRAAKKRTLRLCRRFKKL